MGSMEQYCGHGDGGEATYRLDAGVKRFVVPSPIGPERMHDRAGKKKADAACHGDHIVHAGPFSQSHYPVTAVPLSPWASQPGHL